MNKNTRKRKHKARALNKGQIKDNTVSSNRKRNMAMRVYLNKGADWSQSVTVHEPFLAHEFVKNKNHHYIEYATFKN